MSGRLVPLVLILLGVTLRDGYLRALVTLTLLVSVRTVKIKNQL